MADEPLPATETPIPPGYTGYILPNGKETLLPTGWDAAKVNAAIATLLAQQERSITQDIKSGYADIAGPVTRAVSSGFQMAGETGLSPYSLKKPSDVLAEAIVPQTLPQAGMAVGTGGLGGIAARASMKQLGSVGMRVLGGGLGGAAGALATGENPLLEGAKGVAGAAGGEVLGKGVELARRGITNLTGGLYAGDAKAVMQAVGGLVPSLKGATTTQEFRDLMLSGTGRSKLMDRLMEGYDRTKTLIGNQPMTVPSLGTTPLSFDAARKELRDLFKQGWGPTDINTLPTPSVFAARDKFHAAMGEVQSEIVRLGNLTGQSQAAGTALTPRTWEMGPTQPKRTWGGDPDPAIEMTPTAQGAQRAGEPSRQGQAALKEFVDARTEFRTGMNIIDLVRRANGPGNRLFRPGTDAPKFQTNVLQGKMSAEEATLRKRLGPDVYETLAQEVFRGAPPGAGDTPGLYLGRLFTRQSTPGGGMYERFPITSIPSHAGRPFQAGGGQQSLLDILMQRGLSIPQQPQ